MDRLQKAMQNKDFVMIDNEESPKYVLYGKNSNGLYALAKTHTNGRDFSMNYFHEYGDLCEFIFNEVYGGYDYLLYLFDNR